MQAFNGKIKGKRIVWEAAGELVWLEPYGRDALRFRSCKSLHIDETPDGNLLPPGQEDINRRFTEIAGPARRAREGSRRRGVVLWSGDGASVFRLLRDQIKAGLNASLCGVHQWTTGNGPRAARRHPPVPARRRVPAAARIYRC